jgi:hypothetical protein
MWGILPSHGVQCSSRAISPRQHLHRLATSLMKLRNFDIEQSILAGDITVLLTVGAPRVQYWNQASGLS